MSRERTSIICRDALARTGRLLSDAITDRAAGLDLRSDQLCDRAAHEVRDIRRVLIGLAGSSRWPDDEPVGGLTLLDCLNRVTQAHHRIAVAADGIAAGGACTAQLSEGLALLHGVPFCLTRGRL